MRTVEGLKLRTLIGEQIIVADGPKMVNFNKIIMLNETAAFLWNEMVRLGECTNEDLVKSLLDEYEVDEATATESVASTINQWKEIGIIED